MDRLAMYYEAIDEGKVRCLLCPNMCILAPAQVAPCRSRQNIDGKLVATCYAKTIAYSYDPIEKKPLYHFKPGSSILSMGPNACNLHCSYCQNSSVSQINAPTMAISPSELCRRLARESLTQIAFTYTEPFVWYEYIVDVADEAPDIDIILVTNGYLNPEPLQHLLPLISAMNIDLKSMEDEFYLQQCGARLAPVLDTIRQVHDSPVHLEVTNLLIPGLNDSSDQIDELVDFLASLSPDIPLHFSGYHPSFRLNRPQTPSSTVIKACKTASNKLSYVYAGNIGLCEYSNTHCPSCGDLLIGRSGYRIESHLSGSFCHCGKRIEGVFV